MHFSLPEEVSYFPLEPLLSVILLVQPGRPVSARIYPAMDVLLRAHCQFVVGFGSDRCMIPMFISLQAPQAAPR